MTDAARRQSAAISGAKSSSEARQGPLQLVSPKLSPALICPKPDFAPLLCCSICVILWCLQLRWHLGTTPIIRPICQK